MHTHNACTLKGVRVHATRRIGMCVPTVAHTRSHARAHALNCFHTVACSHVLARIHTPTRTPRTRARLGAYTTRTYGPPDYMHKLWHTLTCASSHMHIHTRRHTDVFMSTHAWMFVRTCTLTHARTHACTLPCTHGRAPTYFDALSHTLKYSHVCPRTYARTLASIQECTEAWLHALTHSHTRACVLTRPCLPQHLWRLHAP